MVSWTHKMMVKALLVWGCTDLLLYNLTPLRAAPGLVAALLAVGMACKVALAGLCIIRYLHGLRE